MGGNQLSLGRNWNTADTASLTVGYDWARAELHWADGAMVYELFDTKPEAVAMLRRHGFNA